MLEEGELNEYSLGEPPFPVSCGSGLVVVFPTGAIILGGRVSSKTSDDMSLKVRVYEYILFKPVGGVRVKISSKVETGPPVARSK
jgi:hypothetical protein